MDEFFITADGKTVHKCTNIDTAIKLADIMVANVYVWNKDKTGVELVYAYGELQALQNLI